MILRYKPFSAGRSFYVMLPQVCTFPKLGNTLVVPSRSGGRTFSLLQLRLPRVLDHSRAFLLPRSHLPGLMLAPSSSNIVPSMSHDRSCLEYQFTVAPSQLQYVSIVPSLHMVAPSLLWVAPASYAVSQSHLPPPTIVPSLTFGLRLP